MRALLTSLILLVFTFAVDIACLIVFSAMVKKGRLLLVWLDIRREKIEVLFSIQLLSLGGSLVCVD